MVMHVHTLQWDTILSSESSLGWMFIFSHAIPLGNVLQKLIIGKRSGILID
jgi:hypothetical protein